MYSFYSYGTMIGDSLRVDAYARSLRAAVKPGSVVLDIGTGTGIFALLACRFGAGRVYAIEPANAVQVAYEIAVANGCAERIEFIQELSTRVTLPERADVIVSDLRGVLPLFGNHLPSIVDARRRLLAPGGILIPQCDVLWAAVVEAPDLYSDSVAPWEHNGFGLDMTAARRIVTNTWRKARVNPEQLLAKPQSWVTLDYSTLEGVHVSHEMTWTALRAGTAHGLSIWFDSTLAQGVHISNAPGEPELCYGNAFFPWLQPVDVRAGDIISVALHANLVGEDYVWRWNTSVFDQHGPQRLKARFNQSTFFAAPLTRAHIAKQAADYVPTLSENGQIDSLILQLMESGTSLGEIAHRVSASFPTHFIDWYDALTRVGEVSQNYSR